MGVKNFLIEGVSCTGKTTVCIELERRGYHAVHGDRELAYCGEPTTGRPADGGQWIWDIEKVRTLMSDTSHPATFFCGGSRNSSRFLDGFDEVFVLEVDTDTLNRRLAARPEDQWGGTASDAEAFARRQHATKQGLPPNAVVIDATAPVTTVVDSIIDHTQRI
ncbi:MAG: nucleoside kinase [Planctomycetota bacterium]